MSASATGRLLAWFGGAERDVPWRDEDDPFRVLLAEVMAQQTRMETVAPYYQRFVRRFPDAAALAEADPDDVMKAWEGLGYYARARNLMKAARRIVERHAGRVPEDVEGLRSLPGVGPYTAGAVASIAFGLPEPAIDGNARRVLARLFDLEDESAAAFEASARTLLADAPDRPGAVNQAIMDLGNRVCRPRRPRCEACPVAGDCLALARDTVAIRPAPRTRKPVPTRVAAAAAIRADEGILVIRRPASGLLGGLWDLPHTGMRDDAGGPASADEVAAEIEREHGVRIARPARVAEVAHAFSHFRLRLSVWESGWIDGTPSSESWRWVGPDAIGELAFPAYLREVIPRYASGSGTS